MAGILAEAGDLAADEAACAAGLARCREAGDMWSLSGLLGVRAELDLRTDRTQDAAAHLREALQITARTGGGFELANILYTCAWLCPATGRPAYALTAWAALTAICQREGRAPAELKADYPHQQALRSAEQALGPAQARAAEERGAAMNPDTAAEYALMLTAPGSQQPRLPAALSKLSARERELITLVAQGRTDAQIAAELYISVRTVHTHLDRIRDKTGCRRRADLTRLALAAGLI